MKSLFHDQFLLPKNKIYMCGHSLGPMPKKAHTLVQQGLYEWEHSIVCGWNEADWFHLPQRLGEKIALLIGALTHEVIVSDNTTLNLLKLLLTGIKLTPQRNKLLTEIDNFPADLYMAKTVGKLHPTLAIKAVEGKDILAAMNEEIGVLLLTHVNYRTSFQHDIAKIQAKAQALGIIVIWDLSHSVGILPIDCKKEGIAFAVGCTYKYLNGGPGAPSFIVVDEKHHAKLSPSIQGWMGHKTPFTFSPDYEPAPGVNSFLSGTPPILSMKALHGALDIFTKIDMKLLREKSTQLSNLLINQCKIQLPQLHCVSPHDPKQRGGHVAFTHPHAFALSRALIANGVIVDYREPHLIRFGFSPLYIDEQDIEYCVDLLVNIMQTESYLGACYEQRTKVT